MGAPVAGQDLGPVWPPVPNPTMVGGASTVGIAANLPAGGLPPTPTSPVTKPSLNVQPLLVPSQESVSPVSAAFTTTVVPPLAASQEVVTLAAKAFTTTVDPSRVVSK